MEEQKNLEIAQHKSSQLHTLVMQREIKFRAWDKINKQWIMPNFCGDLCVGEDVTIVRDFKPNNNGGYSFDTERIYENIDLKIMQFTGLKDKNGKEIYEGDILRLRPMGTKGDKDYSKIVKFQDYHCDSANAYSCRWIPFNHSFSECEVIGNIFENPELVA